MFGKVKSFAMRKVLESQLKNVPEQYRKMIMEFLDKNPELVQKVMGEMQAELKSNGNNQQAAALKVLPKYQSEIMAAMTPEMREALMKFMGSGAMGQFNPNGTIRR
ncbi:hypothetical protein KC887_05380 [Candidatus Kaiserbacteria bacterium]|nr:hypothetical protein [Candidatus Kaiserbacteria bacterium]